MTSPQLAQRRRSTGPVSPTLAEVRNRGNDARRAVVSHQPPARPGDRVDRHHRSRARRAIPLGAARPDPTLPDNFRSLRSYEVFSAPVMGSPERSLKEVPDRECNKRTHRTPCDRASATASVGGTDRRAKNQARRVHWFDGSPEDTSGSAETGRRRHLRRPSTRRRPGSYLARSDASDVARVEDRTFICCEREMDAARPTTGATRRRCARRCDGLFDGAMSGRTMYVVPFSMGPLGSPIAQSASS